MPTGRTIRQSVLHHETHGHRDDPERVVALWKSQVRHVHVEVGIALAAIVLRVCEEDVTRPLKDQVAEVVQCPLSDLIAIAAPTTFGAWSPRIVSAAFDPQRLRQVFNTGNSLGTISVILSRS
jgi:hypothetical protein